MSMKYLFMNKIS